MPVILSRRRFFATLVLSSSALTNYGCGTILYPERRGQPAGRLDWGVVLLDGIGLVLFFVPGVIAFAVDFATGAIYLPPDDYGDSRAARSASFRRVKLPRQQLTPDEIARAVAAVSRKPVSLRAGTYATQPIESLDAFWRVHDQLSHLPSDPASCMTGGSRPILG